MALRDRPGDAAEECGRLRPQPPPRSSCRVSCPVWGAEPRAPPHRPHACCGPRRSQGARLSLPRFGLLLEWGARVPGAQWGPPPLAQCPALRRQLRPASTRPCLSPAGTFTGRSCHLDPRCPGSDETLRHGEEGVGAHGPGPTPGSRRRPQRPGVAGAPLRGPPPARHLVTVVAKSRDRCGLPRVATRPRQPGTGPARCRERLSSHL